MKRFVLTSLASLVSAAIPVTLGYACPSVAGLPDVNCDGYARVAVVGDSVVYGTGDVVNQGKGGYVARIAKRFRKATFYNLGVRGEEARRVIGVVESSFAGTGDSAFASSLTAADIVILDLGRNDWWQFKPAIATWRNLKRVREVIQSSVLSVTGHKPLVVTSQLMGANRTGQGAWVIELNKFIAANHTALTPSDLRFNSVNKRLLIDRVHPSSAGYDAVAKVLYHYLSAVIPRHVAVFRPDTDRDGLYDEYESERFGTSPQDPDTDDDGLLDGEDASPA